MARWILIGLTLAGLVTAFLTRSPGVLGVSILMILIGSFGTVFSIAAERVSANARPDASMLPPEALLAIREKAKARASEGASSSHGEARPGPAVGGQRP
ncbi:hypothetical protein [Dokdonella immobilis]|uniref:Uncharacterized protein n=1 Tax=Dokdonella immobilis TaxID=578942 RepID=A0A1I4YKR7_9GAMM|nr:hypothetical protein [Dokdonella immobilis]SFN38651.1 hypothetical protein SAMN05216289_11830 [Dokdonella immobilis]